MDNGDILNKDLWKVCRYKVIFCQSADLRYLQKKKKLPGEV